MCVGAILLRRWKSVNAKGRTIREIPVICDSYLRKIMQLLFGELNLVQQIEVSPIVLDNFFDSIILGDQTA